MHRIIKLKSFSSLLEVAFDQPIEPWVLSRVRCSWSGAAPKFCRVSEWSTILLPPKVRLVFWFDGIHFIHLSKKSLVVNSFCSVSLEKLNYLNWCAMGFNIGQGFQHAPGQRKYWLVNRIEVMNGLIYNLGRKLRCQHAFSRNANIAIFLWLMNLYVF